MSTDPLAILAAANPVPDLPAVAPVDTLACLAESPPPPRSRGPRRPRVLALYAASVVALAATGVGLALSSGSSGPGVNVAAAAYAATSSGSGMIEAEFVIRGVAPAANGTMLRHREWLGGAGGRRREQTFGPRGETQSELAISPGWTEIWSSGPTPAGTIFRFRDQTRRDGLLKPNGLAFYRRLYQGGAIKVVGREMLDGRSLWKLEGNVGFRRRSRRGRLEPIFGEVILVDPTTYLPVIERQVDLTRPGHPTLLETRLVRYRRLPHSSENQALVRLTAVHPGARIVSRRIFVPLHVARQRAKRPLQHPRE